LNGKFLMRHTAGYLGFDVRLDGARSGASASASTPSVKYGAGEDNVNVVAIRVDASFGSGHWYEGGGLVRKTYLVHTPTSLRFAPDGIFAQSNGSSIPASGRNVIIVPTAEVSTS
jgi:hypothetical protein